jgi:hypothetical protein
MRLRLHAALFVLLLAALNASAQESAERLSLRLTPFEGASPMHFVVADSGVTEGKIGVNFLRRLDVPRPPKGDGLQWLSFHVSRRDARVAVSLTLARETGGALDLLELGEYEVGPDEERRVTALEEYGLEPVRLGAVRRAPVKFPQPPVVNLTRSVAVLGVEVGETRPTFELTLKNVSGRGVMVVEVRLMKGGVMRGYLPQSNRGERLWAPPGGIWKARLGAMPVNKLSPEGHLFEQPDEIVVAAVLFADGGYEGDVTAAASYAAMNFGRRVQAGRVLDTARDWKQPEGSSTADAARELRGKVRALTRMADDALLDEFMSRYAELPAGSRERMKGLVEYGLNEVRTDVLTGLKTFTSSGASQSDPLLFAKWLASTRAKYEGMLAVN